MEFEINGIAVQSDLEGYLSDLSRKVKCWGNLTYISLFVENLPILQYVVHYP